MRTNSAAFVLVAALATYAAAQTPNNLIGLTGGTPLLYQRDQASCSILPFCTPAGFPPAPTAFAGGTAWDSIRNAAVISNGFVIAEVNPDTCAYVCPPSPAPTLSPNAMVTGLEFVTSLNQIWMIDSFGILYQLQHSCPPVVLSNCNTGLPQALNRSTGGLAVDEINRLVFYSYSDWALNTTTIHIAPMNNPCQWFQVVTPATCPGSIPLRAVTGLAVDSCRRILYITDGVQTIGWAYNVLPGPVVAFGPQNCCVLPMPATDTMVGLAVRSGRATSTGTTCANGACPACPMVHSLLNSPNLGNPSFALALDQAPTSAIAFCAIGIGPCSAVGPVAAPFCGPILIGPLQFLLGPVVTTAGIGCTGSATFIQPIPMNPTLCGIVASSQCFAACTNSSGSVVGWTQSNCLSFEVQSN